MNRIPITFKLEVCLNGDAPNSGKAAFNLKVFCRKCILEGRPIDSVGIFRNPKKVLREVLIFIASVVRILPEHIRSIGATLTDTPLLARV